MAERGVVLKGARASYPSRKQSAASASAAAADLQTTSKDGFGDAGQHQGARSGGVAPRVEGIVGSGVARLAPGVRGIAPGIEVVVRGVE